MRVPHLSNLLLAASVATLLGATGASAQGVPGQGVTSQGAAAQPPGSAEAPAAGAVPTLQQQQTVGVPQSESEPKRAPGAKVDGGTSMPLSSPDSGTTESFANAEPEEPVQWPCAQRRVPTISAGTIWSGPDVAGGKDWDQDNQVAALAQRLASRRLPLDQVDPLVAELAKGAGPDKDKKLTELFVGVLDIINTNRDQVLDGIMRYARGQERLAERMRKESDAISEKLTDVQGPTGIAATEQNRDFTWDQRIFKERRQALTYVCETPSLLERRAYEVAKRIQAQL